MSPGYALRTKVNTMQNINRIDHNHKIINCKLWFAKINGSDKLVQTSLSAFDGIRACNNDIELIKHPEDGFFSWSLLMKLKMRMVQQAPEQ